MAHPGPDFVRAGDVYHGEGVCGRLDPCNVHFLKLFDVIEHTAELGADGLLLLVREPEPGEVGDVGSISTCAMAH